MRGSIRVGAGRHRAPALTHVGRELLASAVWLAVTAGFLAAAIKEAHQQHHLFWLTLFNVLLASIIGLYASVALDCYRWFFISSADFTGVQEFVDCDHDEPWCDHDPGE